jgi:hypothetical protein
MKKSLLFTVSLFSMFSVLVAAPQAAYACSCMAPGTPQAELNKSAAVFSGTVVSVNPPADGSRYVMFDVDQAWKGVTTSNVAISTPQDSAMCGIDFVEDKQYIVYAHQGDGGNLSVNLCSRTHEIGANDDADIVALGTPSPVTPIETPAEPRKSNTGIVIAVLIVAVAAVGIAARRKKQQSV